MEIAALVIGIVALFVAVGFGIWQSQFNRKIENRLFGSGTTLLQVHLMWQNNSNLINCQVQTKEISLTEIMIEVGPKKKKIGNLAGHKTKAVTFNNVDRGEKWTVTFIDPNKKIHKESYQVWGNELLLFG